MNDLIADKKSKKSFSVSPTRTGKQTTMARQPRDIPPLGKARDIPPLGKALKEITKLTGVSS